jgi:ectoine hydroxylase-related dioxygenase (phytanoyl-CoA dioxygenase family)
MPGLRGLLDREIHLNDDQKYFFDINGYLVIEDALARDEVHVLNEAIDENANRIRIREGDALLSGGSSELKGRQGRGDLNGMLTWPQPWCQPFRDLLAHPSIVPPLVEILRDGFRVDHIYGIVMETGAEGHVQHGGGTVDDLSHFYQFHNGRMRCGLTVVGWNLTDANPGDGGFACIPCSHKANYVAPRDIARLETDNGMVQQIPAPAGSAIIFTEALTHGTLPWKAEHSRRSILYKYSPGPLANEDRYIPEDIDLDELTPAQRAVLQPPYQDRRPSVVQPGSNLK